MTNAETAAHLRQYIAGPWQGTFSWPTDACGYTQHMRFVEHRNKEWSGVGSDAFNAFVLSYADAVERGDHGPDPEDNLP